MARYSTSWPLRDSEKNMLPAPTQPWICWRLGFQDHPLPMPCHTIRMPSLYLNSGKLYVFDFHTSVFRSWREKKHIWLQRDKIQISQPINLTVPAKTEHEATALGTHSRKNPFPSEPSDAKKPSLPLSRVNSVIFSVCVCVSFCNIIDMNCIHHL